MAALVASAGQLPALAALPSAVQSGQSHRAESRLNPAGSPMLLAEKKDDDDDKKKKKKKSTDNQRSPQKQQDRQQHQQQKPKSQQKKSSDQDRQNRQKQGSGQPANNRLNEKQRERIYEQGRQEGLQKGRQKGFEKGRDRGFEEGFDKGKQKGFRKGYDLGHDRGRKRQQWSSWDRNQWRRYNTTRRNIWVTPVTYRPAYAGYPAWARNSNWGYSRPWGGGWYQSSSNPYWSWWAGQALGWGVNALTTALIVNNAMNNAIRQSRPTLAVPNSNWQLYYGTVQPVDDTLVTFVVNNGTNHFQMQADCDDGLLNGEVPTTYAEAELINTACQITYGSI
ncbi:hypothetical protein [Cyanobium sp. CH-040]|uniref:hypothetical protein n=1 Tax=Cyanobium sp. CH-040 TaxID=2823708 RepID=UPI0020CC749B|nr:hypothetical protein [Cyanobium sp. CH-040]